MHILLVDDSEEGRDVTEAMLLVAGYENIETESSGTGALALLGIGAPARKPVPLDLVLLDVVMPDMDGIETCARIRNDPRYADAAIIMVTRLSDTDSLANAFVAGATDYIHKPVNRVELLARVRSALKLKAELDRRKAREAELLAMTPSTRIGDTSRWTDKGDGASQRRGGGSLSHRGAQI